MILIASAPSTVSAIALATAEAMKRGEECEACQ
jgi:hypothetical protein